MYRVSQRARLFINLLEHKMVIAALLRLLNRPRGGQRLYFSGNAVRLKQRKAVRCDAHNLAFANQSIVARVL